MQINSMDMSLDNFINMNPKNANLQHFSSGIRGKFRGRRNKGNFGGGTLSAVNTNTNGNAGKRSQTYRPTPKQKNRVINMFEDSMAAGGMSSTEPDKGTKLYVSNLDEGVSNTDLKKLFSAAGKLRRWGLHYDTTGNPMGTAEVTYANRRDAAAAVKLYNNALLDGKLMKIEVIGGNITRSSSNLKVNSVVPRFGGRQRGRGRGRGRGSAEKLSSSRYVITGGSNNRWNGGGRTRHNERGRGRLRWQVKVRNSKKPPFMSAAQLDKDLESYHAETMQA